MTDKSKDAAAEKDAVERPPVSEPQLPPEMEDRVVIGVVLPRDVTMHDLATAKGMLFDAASRGVDWEKLYAGESDAASKPSQILLAIASQLPK